MPDLQVLQCGDCGEQLFNNEAGDRIAAAFRAVLGLVRPEELREGRKALGLSQKEFAAKLRFAEESVSRWETGALIQSRHADTLIRLYFASPEFRRLLDTANDSPDFGRTVNLDEPAVATGPMRSDAIHRWLADQFRATAGSMRLPPETLSTIPHWILPPPSGTMPPSPFFVVVFGVDPQATEQVARPMARLTQLLLGMPPAAGGCWVNKLSDVLQLHLQGSAGELRTTSESQPG